MKYKNLLKEVKRMGRHIFKNISFKSRPKDEQDFIEYKRDKKRKDWKPKDSSGRIYV